MSDDDVCGYVKESDGEPCELPASRDDGRCHHHTDTEDIENGGRPTKLTYERQESIAQMIEDGQSIRAAARTNGVHHETILNWMARGEQQDEGIYADFFDRLIRAKGHGETKYVDAIMEIAKQTNDAAMLMSMLKQRYPDSWGDVKASDQKAGVNVVLEAGETTEIDPETLEELN